MVPRKNLWNRLEEIKVSLELRVVAIRMYEESNKVVPCPLPFLAYTLTS
jgi:hypothetical protein